jgi:transposase
MEAIHSRCAGLDVHKKTVVACVITPRPQGGWHRAIRTFTTMTRQLLELSDWLSTHGCTHVAMESTGEYWKPIFNILEANFEVMLVNAQPLKAVPGRKTDVKDAQWIAELLQHGLLRPSFMPPLPQRQLRDLTRHRTSFIRDAVNLVNRIQKVLEGAKIKLASVASDVMGVSGRAMLNAMVAGETDPVVMADLAQGRLCNKRDQ